VNRVLLKNCAVMGTYWGAYALHDPAVMQQSLKTLLGWYADGRLKPHVDRTLPLEQAADALSALANRESKGKIVLKP
jgi:NADPH2:quinone reductase